MLIQALLHRFTLNQCDQYLRTSATCQEARRSCRGALHHRNRDAYASSSRLRRAKQIHRPPRGDLVNKPPKHRRPHTPAIHRMDGIPACGIPA